ncbi:MAG: HlyD family efflux transporter periplasmic adaptor subunit [Chromatiales bacterium]|nr:HlyD family efflux transporter periplasmic adaptor subunit [Gammaproteobacteria bacterium]MCP5352745.1 HlyD family efflux transporter periplasmic adaptor subunit [Chromatiales bacterium]
MTDSPNKPSRLIRWGAPVLILVLAVGVAIGLVRTKPQAKPVDAGEKSWLVRTVIAQPQAHAPILTLYGRIESLLIAKLTAAVEADIVDITVFEGNPISKDQLLVRLDDRDQLLLVTQREADLRQAEARIQSENTRHDTDLKSLPEEQRLLELARAEVNRQRDLLNKKLGSQSALDTAREAVARQALTVNAREQSVADHTARLAELDANRQRGVALLEQARLELDRTRILAPFDGRVTQVLASPGQRVRKGDGVLVVYGTEGLVLRAQIPNRHLPVVRQALNAGETLRVGGELDGAPIQATLLGLAGEVDAATGGVAGLFRIEGADASLQQGRFLRLDLNLPARPDLIALPNEALYGLDRIYRLHDSRMQPVTVERIGDTRGAQGESLVLVRSDGITAGDVIIATQLPNAMDGLLVRTAGE